MEVFRLAGIYGPQRSVFDNLRGGTARRIIKSGQIFNRIHVDDIARTLAAAIDTDTGYRIFNVSDDEPAPPQDVVAYAAELFASACAARPAVYQMRQGRAVTGRFFRAVFIDQQQPAVKGRQAERQLPRLLVIRREYRGAQTAAAEICQCDCFIS